jgi:glucan-binding YG repeat protein
MICASLPLASGYVGLSGSAAADPVNTIVKLVNGGDDGAVYAAAKVSKKFTGWKKSKGKYYYYVKGKKASGLKTIKGKTYYLKKGLSQKSFQKISKKIYYFKQVAKGKYAMAQGWQNISGQKYYFKKTAKDRYTMVSGWQNISGQKYYFKKTATDRYSAATNWQNIGGQKYYFGTDGVTRTGWQTVDGQKYHFGDDGKMRTGWQTIEDKRYYFGTDGVTRTGWQDIDGQKYYFEPDGALKLDGWQTIDGKDYYFGADGLRLTGWQVIGGQTFWLDDNGACYMGWQLFNEDGVENFAYFKPAPGGGYAMNTETMDIVIPEIGLDPVIPFTVKVEFAKSPSGKYLISSLVNSSGQYWRDNKTHGAGPGTLGVRIGRLGIGPAPGQLYRVWNKGYTYDDLDDPDAFDPTFDRIEPVADFDYPFNGIF